MQAPQERELLQSIGGYQCLPRRVNGPVQVLVRVHSSFEALTQTSHLVPTGKLPVSLFGRALLN